MIGWNYSLYKEGEDTVREAFQSDEFDDELDRSCKDLGIHWDGNAWSLRDVEELTVSRNVELLGSHGGYPNIYYVSGYAMKKLMNTWLTAASGPVAELEKAAKRIRNIPDEDSFILEVWDAS